MSEVIILKHSPKTGGTSLRHSIHEACKAEEILYLYREPLLDRSLLHRQISELRKCYDGNIFWQKLCILIDEKLVDDRIKIVYGHSIPPVSIAKEFIRSREMRFFTMFRHPYTRMISHYNSLRRRSGDGFLGLEDWFEHCFGGESYRDQYLIDYNSFEKYYEEYSQYEKILFYEEYQNGLDYLSDLLKFELKEYRENISTKYVGRSSETDKVVDRYLPHMVKLYDYFKGESS
jgi:hypothetical protein